MTGRVIAQQWMSLDGFAADADGHEEAVFAGVDADTDARSADWNERLLDTVDEVVLGRRTYEQFVRYWPEAEERIARRVNAVPKTVASSSLAEAPWGRHQPARVVGDLVDHVRHRRADGATLLVWGSLDTASRLHEAGLLDELDLFVAPLLLGAGTPVLRTQRPVLLDRLATEDWGAVSHVRLGIRR